MEKLVNDRVNKGSTIEDTLSTLKEKGTVKTNVSTFKSVLQILRTSYKKLVEGKTLTVDYGNFEITLN